MNIVIKKATIDDLETVDLFQLKLTDDQKIFDRLHKQKGKIRYQTKRSLQKILTSEKDGCFIAHDNNKPVGFCLFQVVKNRRFWAFKEKGYIADMYVEKEYRHQGIVSKLLKLAIDHFNKLGLKDIRIHVLCCNENAIAVYEKAGFKKRLYEMQYDQ